ncbi:MAG: LptF/LptG family permease [Calditrichia bacterium]
MKLIDKYILGKFLVILGYTILAFIVVFVVIDLIENLDKFLNSKAGLTYGALYYFYYIPFIITLTLPVCMLLSSLFSIGSMAQHNELIASLSAGISLHRLVAPILILAFGISILAGLFSETIVPESNRRRLDIWRYDIRKQARSNLSNRRQIALQDIDNKQVHIYNYQGKKQLANKVSIIWIEGDRITQRWDARLMKWSQNLGGWKMEDIVVREFTDSLETMMNFDSLLYADTRIFPEDLLELQIKPEEMNYFELDKFVSGLAEIGADSRKWLVDLYMKISYPLASFIIVLFGAPLASRKRRSGPALGFALALLISFVYFGFMRAGQVLGHNATLNPWLGAWVGNMVFFVGGVIMMFRVRK